MVFYRHNPTVPTLLPLPLLPFSFLPPPFPHCLPLSTSSIRSLGQMSCQVGENPVWGVGGGEGDVPPFKRHPCHVLTAHILQALASWPCGLSTPSIASYKAWRLPTPGNSWLAIRSHPMPLTCYTCICCRLVIIVCSVSVMCTFYQHSERYSTNNGASDALRIKTYSCQRTTAASLHEMCLEPPSTTFLRSSELQRPFRPFLPRVWVEVARELVDAVRAKVSP